MLSHRSAAFSVNRCGDEATKIRYADCSIPLCGKIHPNAGEESVIIADAGSRNNSQINPSGAGSFCPFTVNPASSILNKTT